MSKKVKDLDRGPHEAWCDTQNNISERCNCIVSGYIEKIEELERKLKMQQELYYKLDSINCELNRKLGVAKKTIIAASEFCIEMSEHISKADYTINELKQPFEIGSPMYDGTVASYKAQFEEALKQIEEEK